ncbi:hypothetical protein [Paenibacillus gansuensis]|uniref:Uncharacterized protein n=1 Tax=Paenibacillus gansuensis TaxID=306542 RepID=A0ABW5PDX6_9BACL
MPKRYRYTILFTLFGVLLCLINLSGYDPHNLLFFNLSVPMWIIEAFYDTHKVSLTIFYITTILSYTVMGAVIDYFIQVGRSRSTDGT